MHCHAGQTYYFRAKLSFFFISSQLLIFFWNFRKSGEVYFQVLVSGVKSILGLLCISYAFYSWVFQIPGHFCPCILSSFSINSYICILCTYLERHLSSLSQMQCFFYISQMQSILGFEFLSGNLFCMIYCISSAILPGVFHISSAFYCQVFLCPGSN